MLFLKEKVKLKHNIVEAALKTDKKVVMGILAIAVFNFVFLGNEYMYDNMMMYVTDAGGVVTAQNIILGVSVAGFLLFPVISCLIGKMHNNSQHKYSYVGIFGMILMLTAGIACIWVMSGHKSYMQIFIAGSILFIIIGVMGSAVHYNFAAAMKGRSGLTIAAGIAYAGGIVLQFINNNLIKNDIAQTVVLCTGLVLLCILYASSRKDCGVDNPEIDNTGRKQEIHYSDTTFAAIMLVITVVLMTCIFSTLDNAVTVVHAQGQMDIGQWPRVMLALSGLAAGWLFNIANRRYMNVSMYCITLLSVICVIIIMLGGPFIIGLIAFYVSAGFFVVYFTGTFVEMSYSVKCPKLWAGMGRTVNNAAAVLVSYISLMLMSGNTMVLFIVIIVLLAAISLRMYLFNGQQYVNNLAAEVTETAITEEETEYDKLTAFAQMYVFTEREKEVLQVLTSSEESMSDIASNLCMSRTALYNHIASMNRKTETKARIGLIQFFYSWNQKN